MSLMPSLRQLEYLVALADYNSFSRAAEHCHVTQSTLSAGIAALEDLLGQPLADRSRRKVTLTPLGEEIAAKGRNLIISATDIMRRAHQVRAPLAGPLRLGVIPTIAPYLLPRLLPVMQKDLPDMELQLQEDLSARLVDNLENGRLDIALMALPYDTPGMTQELLWEESFYLACPPGYWEKKTPVRLEDLQDEPLLLLEEGHCLRSHALAACQLQASNARNTFSTTSLPTLMQMVRHEYGITLLPEMAVTDLHKDEDINILSFSSPPPTRDIGLVWRTNSPRAKTYKMLAGMMKELKSSG